MTMTRETEAKTVGSNRSERGTWPVYGLAVLLGAALLSGCDRGRTTHGGTEPPSEIERLAIDARDRDPALQTLAHGRAVYEHYCLICHGSEGRGDGFNSSNVSVSPRDFSNFAFRQTTDQDHLFKAVHGGGTAVGKSVLMPAWGHTLDEAQIRDVVSYLLSIPVVAQSDEPDAGDAEQ